MLKVRLYYLVTTRSKGMLGKLGSSRRCISSYRTADLHVWKGSINICSRPDYLFFRERLCIFQQDDADLRTAAITKTWLHGRVRMLDWPASSPDVSPTENIWCIMKQNSKKKIQDCIAARILHQTSANMPLQSLVQRMGGFFTGVNIWLCPIFLEF